MQTWHLHITGQVQGVGFRPFVYALAQRMGLTGVVNNSRDGVHVWFNAEASTARNFAEMLYQYPPPLAILTQVLLQEEAFRFFPDFQIVHSDHSGASNLMIAPDFGLCNDCLREMDDPDNRRANYPFITCTHCGPRYGIMEALPYDRAQTAMEPFTMCQACAAEYHHPEDRRYFSQTNSCPDCSIVITLVTDQETSSTSVRDKVVAAWRSGKIVAIKGTGGFLLTCDAAQAGAIRLLRERKARPQKPLALMYHRPAELNSCYLSKSALDLINNPAAPIVLVPVATDFPNLEWIAPGLQSIGLMRAHNPLFHWLLDAFEGPIVATSANISQNPIIFRDSEVPQLFQLADLVLTHNRKIVVSQDDSLVRFSPLREKPILLRRARGYAPTLIQQDLKLRSTHLLATGALLKSTFALQMDDRCYVSQYLGNLDSFATEQNYQHTLQHLQSLLGVSPERILCDAHPDYPSTHTAIEMASKLNVSLQTVQHHLAHFAAVLGENNGLHSQDPILGVIWDGAGYGTDGQIWGGEFFTYSDYQFERIGHFEYFKVLAGDKMAREPRLAALSLCKQLPDADPLLRPLFTPLEWDVYAKLLERNPVTHTSSAGRLFDALAALLGLCTRQSWEGAAATQLEELATRYCQTINPNQLTIYPIRVCPTGDLDTTVLFSRVIRDILQGIPAAHIAASFHYSLAALIKQVAQQTGISQLAFSGGVFQNGLLCDLIQYLLSDGYKLLFHRQLPPNDENISFGQLVYHHITQYRQSFLNPKSQEYVLSNSR